MDCRDAAELLDSFILGALDPKDKDEVEAHVEGCSDCEARLRQDGELVVQMAYAAPRLVAPDRIRTRLMQRIAGESPADLRPAADGGNWAARAFGGLRRAFAAQAGLAAAAVLAVVVVGGGVWFNNRLDSVSEENSLLKARLDDAGVVEADQATAIAAQVEEALAEQEVLLTKVTEMSEADVEMMDMIKEQRDLAYMLASPDKLVSVLTSTSQATAKPGAEAQGMIIFEGEGGSAFLTARELPANEEGSLYRVWLVKDGVRHDGGVFGVDSTGYGQTVVIPVGSWDEIDAIEITSVPTGQRILRGDL